MASATRGTPWPLPLHCRPLTSQFRFPPSSVRYTPIISTRIRALSISESSSASVTSVKPKNVQNEEFEGPESLPEDENETEKRAFETSNPYGNLVRFKRPINVQIFVDENESDDSVELRFRRDVWREGILQECRRRQFHESNQDKKKRKSQDTQRRLRNIRNRRYLRKKREEEIEERQYDEDDDDDDDEEYDDDDDDDDWELPEEDIGF